MTGDHAEHDLSAVLYDLLNRAGRHRSELAHELALGTTDVAALWEIARHPGLRPGDLARGLGLGVAGTTSVVDKLVRSGFLRREKNSTDRRSVNLVLTPAGRHACAWLHDEVDGVVRTVAADAFDAGTAERLLSALGTAFAVARDASAAAAGEE